MYANPLLFYPYPWISIMSSKKSRHISHISHAPNPNFDQTPQLELKLFMPLTLILNITLFDGINGNLVLRRNSKFLSNPKMRLN